MMRREKADMAPYYLSGTSVTLRNPSYFCLYPVHGHEDEVSQRTAKGTDHMQWLWGCSFGAVSGALTGSPNSLAYQNVKHFVYLLENNFALCTEAAQGLNFM